MRLFIIAALAVSFGVFVIPVGAQAVPAEEFVGPFPSWRQVQCTGVDDTAMLQAEFNTLGRSGSPVLYIKAGTCRITSTLRLGQGAPVGQGGVQNITVLGHDPADTKILWAGPSCGTMIEVNGVGHSRYGRLTWDAANKACIIWLDKTGGGNYFPTGNRHEDEVFMRTPGYAFYLGSAGVGTSEWEYMRMKFIGPMQAGIFLGNANTLDHWVWDSLFQNVQAGLGNNLGGSWNNSGAGGDWGINRSVFLNNNDDVRFGNVQPFGSSRWNYSRGSSNHINYFGVGRVHSSISVQGAMIIDPLAQSPIGENDTGPLSVFDTTIRGGKATGMIGVHEAYCDVNCLGDLWGIGNTFSNTSPSQYAIPWPCCGRIHALIDDKLGQTITDPGPPALPPTPPQSTAPIIEVQGGNIAAALAAAGSSRAIVHIPYGQYFINSTLNVGPNVTLTGDGYAATQLRANNASVNPILRLAGPSHAIVRDLSLLGWTQNGRVTTGLLIDNADQPGGLVHSEDAILQRSEAAWDVRNLAQTTVDLFDDNNGANSHCDGGGANPSVDYKVIAAKLHIFNGAGAGSDAMFSQQGGEIVDMTHYFEGNPGCGPATLMAPGSSGTFVLDQANFSPIRGGVDLGSHTGMATLTGFSNTLAAQSNALTARRFGPNTLVLGFDYGNLHDDTYPTFTGSPYVLWLPQRVGRDATGTNDARPEAVSGVANTTQFMRDHLAPLRAAKPLSLAARPSNVTDVRLYRVGGELLTSAIKVMGSGALPPPTNTPVPGTATPTPTVVPPTATPRPTNTPLPAATSTPTQTPLPAATATPTRTATAVPPTSTPMPPATPTTIPATPTNTPVPMIRQIIGFDSLPGENHAFSGQYPAGVVDWGTNRWWVASPWEQFTTKSISFNGAGSHSESFTFVSPHRLVSIEADSIGPGTTTVTLSCAGQPTRTFSVPVRQPTSLVTNWTGTCSTVTITTSNGWDTNFDNLVFD